MASGGESDFVRKAPLMVADDAGYDASLFVLPSHFSGAVSSVLLPAGLIRDRVDAVARDIIEHYKDGEVVHLLCTLKGANDFCVDLARAIREQAGPSGRAMYTMDFIRCKSYDGTESTGVVSVEGVKKENLVGRHVLVVEDIVDTGRTMAAVLPQLREHARSVRLCSLLEKRTTRSIGLKADFVAFSVPDSFLIGYGLDYDEVGRDLRHICVLSEEGVRKFKEWGKKLAISGKDATATEE